MRNVNNYMLKKCIFLTSDEYECILKKLFGDTIRVEFSMDGIWVGYDGEDFLDVCEEPDIYTKLAAYFDVTEVTSVHMDDCEYVGVWICYKD